MKSRCRSRLGHLNSQTRFHGIEVLRNARIVTDPAKLAYLHSALKSLKKAAATKSRTSGLKHLPD
jgi:hypothetical protein